MPPAEFPHDDIAPVVVGLPHRDRVVAALDVVLGVLLLGGRFGVVGEGRGGS